MISSINSYSSNLFIRANNSLVSKLAGTETIKDSTSNMILSNEATESSTFSNSRSSLSLEELLGKMQQTAQKNISNSPETNSDTTSSDISSFDTDGDGC